MKVFKVYKHNTKGYAAVKVGFSWPALFFSAFWCLIKGFFFLFLFFLIVNWALILYALILEINLTKYGNIMSNEVFAWYAANSLGVLIVSLILLFIPGFKGNAWLDKKYIKKGYALVESIPAISKKAAIELINTKAKESATYEKDKTQDDFQTNPNIINKKAYVEAYEEIKEYENEDNSNDKLQFIINETLWAEAYVQSDGDENKQKLIYVKLRSKELDDIYQLEIDKKRAEERKKERRFLILFAVAMAALIFLTR
jgi:hypothetical protein